MAQTQTAVGQSEPAVTPVLTSASGTNAVTFFLADRAYTVASASYILSAHTSGAGPTLNIFKDTSTNAPGAGSSVLNAAVLVDSTITANTTTAAPLTTGAPLSLAAGDRLSWQLSGTLTSLAGLVATLQLIPA